MGTNNEWIECYVTGVDEENRSYQVVFENTGKTLRHTRSHLKPRGPDFPHISDKYKQPNSNLVPSGREVSTENPVLSEAETDLQEGKQIQPQNLVISGSNSSLERDTAVSLVSDAPAKRVTFPDNQPCITDTVHTTKAMKPITTATIL